MSRPIIGDDVFRAISHPVRRRIVELLLKRGEMSPSEILLAFQLSPTAISQHLRILRDSRLVVQRRIGRMRIYTASAKPIRAIAAWSGRFVKS